MKRVPVLLLQRLGRVYYADVDAYRTSSVQELCAEVPGRLHDGCTVLFGAWEANSGWKGALLTVQWWGWEGGMCLML